eukprot:TRINITY_DN9205_c0_g1_i1.p1 TRINITY_DN9205_c0_g1~~TRINITY_DN9205_c0_g1_i1.p1  ORF type:complete len:226 (+),score=31.18 TRINITY_DN9205_c0_g1_i1:58-678(+)
MSMLRIVNSTVRRKVVKQRRWLKEPDAEGEVGVQSGGPGFGVKFAESERLPLTRPKGYDQGTLTRGVIGHINEAEIDSEKLEDGGEQLIHGNIRRWLHVTHPSQTWTCSKCSNINTYLSKDCESCETPHPKYLHNGPQHWVCGSCLCANPFSKKKEKRGKKYPVHCKNCGDHKSKALTGLLAKEDWVCKPCKIVVKGETCPGCGLV